MGFDDTRITQFRSKVVPKMGEYIRDNPSTLMAIMTAGRLFGVKAYDDLMRMGVPVNYIEAEKSRVATTLKGNRKLVYGRTLIPVDDDIYTQDTFREVNSQIKRVREELKIKDVFWAVEHDAPGVARWSCNRNGLLNKKKTVAEAISVVTISGLAYVISQHPLSPLAGPVIVYGPKVGEVFLDSGKKLVDVSRSLFLE